MSYQVKYSGTIIEPINATLVKEVCKIDYSNEDTFISLLITSCRQKIEEMTGRALVAKTITVFYPEFDSDEPIWLPFPEHATITSVKVNGSSITDYVKTGLSQFILTIPSSYSIGTESNYGLEVVYTTSGYCPEDIKLEMLRLINESYRNRGNTFEGVIVYLDENAYANLAKYILL